VHARLEEMRFRHGVLLMVTAGTVLVAAITLVTMALTGGKNKTPAEPPVADSSSVSRPPSASPTGHSPSPRATRRPGTSSSTMVGVPPSAPAPAATSHPQGRATPGGVPPWWQRDDPRDGRWHGSPPPWWHHH
jgi:hypothetical protein